MKIVTQESAQMGRNSNPLLKREIEMGPGNAIGNRVSMIEMRSHDNNERPKCKPSDQRTLLCNRRAYMVLAGAKGMKAKY